MATKRKCKGEKDDGSACGAHPLRAAGAAKLGLPAEGQDYCAAHHPDLPDSARFGSQEQATAAGLQGGRPRLPRPHEVLRERIESNIDRWLAPLEAALGAGKPVLMWNQAEGKHSIELVQDPELGMKALKLAFDRVYGKPRQQIDLSNESPDQPLRISHELLTDPELRDGLRSLKRRLADARPERAVGAGAGDRPPESG